MLVKSVKKNVRLLLQKKLLGSSFKRKLELVSCYCCLTKLTLLFFVNIMSCYSHISFTRITRKAIKQRMFADLR